MSGNLPPANFVSANGVAVITDANLNTAVQNAGLIANLRNFVGINGMAVRLLGGTVLGDSSNGSFWFNSSSTATDDGINVIQPNGLLTGRWLRLFETNTFGAVIATPSSSVQTTSFTFTAAQMENLVYEATGTAGAITGTTATAAQLVAGWPNPSANQVLPWTFINGNNATITISAGSGVTFAGVGASATTFTISAGSQKTFHLVITNAISGSEAVTMWGTNA